MPASALHLGCIERLYVCIRVEARFFTGGLGVKALRPKSSTFEPFHAPFGTFRCWRRRPCVLLKLFRLRLSCLEPGCLPPKAFARLAQQAQQQYQQEQQLKLQSFQPLMTQDQQFQQYQRSFQQLQMQQQMQPQQMQQQQQQQMQPQYTQFTQPQYQLLQQQMYLQRQ